jgi:DNA primase
MKANMDKVKRVIDRIPHKQNSVSWVFTCPKCQKKDKLYVRKSDGRFVCWVCRETESFYGRVEYALAELVGVPIADMTRQVYDTPDQVAINLVTFSVKDFFDDDEDEVDPDALGAGTVFPPDFFPIDALQSVAGAEYLAGRGIPLEVAVQYGIMFCPPKQRVVFPIYDNGLLMGWQARAIFPTEYYTEDGKKMSVPKILSSKGIPRDRLVMFGQRLTGDTCVLTEGPVDAIKCHGFGSNVCTMGKSISEGQIRYLMRHGIKKIYLALDPDAVADAQQLARIYSGDLQFYMVSIPPQYKDIGEMDFDSALLAIRSATPFNVAHVFLNIRLPQFFQVNASV